MGTDTALKERTTAETAPARPTQLRTRSWFRVFTRTLREFKVDNLTDWTAALTYYGVLATGWRRGPLARSSPMPCATSSTAEVPRACC